MYWIIYSLYFLTLFMFGKRYLRKYYITPVAVFLLLQTIMFVGIIIAPQIHLPHARKLSVIYYIALLFFITGVSFSNYVHGSKRKRTGNTGFYVVEGEFLSQIQLIMLWGILLISILFSIYLFAVSGGNVLVKSINSLFRGDVINIQAERREYLSVPGTGYLYQFRAILVPILSAFFLWGRRKDNGKKIFYNLLFAMALLFVLGSGQRNAFVFFMLFVFIYIFYLYKLFNQKISRLQMILFISLGLLFLGALTITNNRVSSYNVDNVFVGTVLSLFDRFFAVNSRTAITAFGYIDAQPTVWGYDWLMMLADILPGKSDYLSIANIVYYLTYGTYKGTGPPCIWGSAWYNWSIFGVSLFPLLLGYWYQNIYWNFKKRYVDRLQLFLYVSKTVYFGIWFVETPMFLFNNGAVAVLILSILVSGKFFKIIPKQYGR